MRMIFFSEQTRRVLLLRGDAMITSLLNGTKPVRAETLSGEAPGFSGLAAIVASSPSRPAKRWRVIDIQHSLGHRRRHSRRLSTRVRSGIRGGVTVGHSDHQHANPLVPYPLSKTQIFRSRWIGRALGEDSRSRRQYVIRVEFLLRFRKPSPQLGPKVSRPFFRRHHSRVGAVTFSSHRSHFGK